MNEIQAQNESTNQKSMKKRGRYNHDKTLLQLEIVLDLIISSLCMLLLNLEGGKVVLREGIAARYHDDNIFCMPLAFSLLAPALTPPAANAHACMQCKI